MKNQQKKEIEFIIQNELRVQEIKKVRSFMREKLILFKRKMKKKFYVYKKWKRKG